MLGALKPSLRVVWGDKVKQVDMREVYLAVNKVRSTIITVVVFGSYLGADNDFESIS